jgi:hypothetical protein
MFVMALEKKGNRVATLYDSDRLPRSTWQRFRAACTANNQAWVDELNALLTGYADKHEAKEGTEKH